MSRINSAAIFLLLLLFLAGVVCAKEVIPPVPTRYFNDYAHVVNPGVGTELNQQLEDFEKATSSQIVVAIYPTMETDSSIEDYTQRIFRAWRPGQAKLNNGAILFVFAREHRMRIQTGYGLEGALPDAICKRIMDDEIAPHLREGDYNGGMQVGVRSMIQAAKGEYKGTGQTVDQRHGGKSKNNGTGALLIFGIWAAIILYSILFRKRGTGYGSRGSYTTTTYSNWGGGGGGGWSGGGGNSGGGFSGGGGDSGGGGASGSW